MIKKLLRTIVLPALLLVSTAAWSQQGTKVTGRVTDSKDGSGLSGVSVVVKGTNNGVSTDANGNFSLQVPLNTTLIISSVGFGTKEIIVTGADVSTSLAATASSQLNEVVVVAYGTRKKGDLTGAVTSISTKDFQKGFIPSSDQLLQGKVAGLQITSGGGSAGGGSKIRIRSGASLNASNDPLIVVDGLPVESNGLSGSANFLNTINPNDIESMSVLKDASATALYGSRASNGVIIITTKKGTSKGKPVFNFNTLVSAGAIGETIDVLTGDQVRSLVKTPSYKDMLGTANTDWQKQIYQTAMGNDNNLSISGGIAKIPYRASLGYLNQEGILKTNKFDRLSGSLNLSPKFFTDHLAVNVQLKGVRTNNRFADEGAIGNAVGFDPTQEIHAENKYGGYFEWLQANGNPNDQSNLNPVALIDLTHNTSTVQRFVGNIQLDYRLHFFPDLHVLVNVGMDVAKGEGDVVIDTNAAANWHGAHKSDRSKNNVGKNSHYQQKKQNTLADVSLFYTKELESIRGKIDVLVGHSYQDFLTKDYNYATYNYYGNLVDAADTPLYKFNQPQNRLESYLGRVNFSLHDKYLLTASIRRDASSRFSPDNRVGYFPAVALAWKLKQEFFRESKVLSDLKLRLGWGKTGQQDGIGNYAYLLSYEKSTSTASYQFGDQFYNFYRPTGFNKDLQWESTATSNIGLDFGFAGNRIYGSVDFYKKKTEDLLFTVPLAPGSNYATEFLKNVGNMENTGVEFALNTTPVKTNDFTWDFGFNITWNKSKITKVTNDDPNFRGVPTGGIEGGTGNTVQIFAANESPYTFLVYKQIYDRTTGRPIEGLYEDVNRDGLITVEDKNYYKQASPDVLFGINTQVIYKKFSLGFAGHASIGNYTYNNVNSSKAVYRNIENPTNFIGNTTTDYQNTGFFNNQYWSDYFIENASFFRLDNINLGYNAGRIFNSKASLRVNASVQNVFVITKYSGLDPEIASDGIDRQLYPRPRVFSLGFNLDF